MRLFILLPLFFIFIASGFVQAQQSELVDRIFTGTSKDKNPQIAKKEIQDQATLRISEDIIKELIGEQRFSKNKTLISNKIIKNSARYIPFMKPTNMTEEAEEFKMAVSLKVSLKDLKQMLQENSLLNENDAIPVVLPMVTWVDRVEGRSYRWWTPLDKNQHSFLLKEGRHLEQALRASFAKNGFYVIRPLESGLGVNVPLDFQGEKISAEDAQYFSQYFNAPVIIDGQVLINKSDRGQGYKIEIRMTAMQVSNGRAIADVSRRFETAAGALESVVDKKVREVVEGTASDLSAQVLEAWQRGSLGTSLVRVTIRGLNNLPFTEKLKETIRSEISQVKNIRERLISSEAVSFDLETSVSGPELMSKLEGLSFDGKKLSKVSEAQEELVLKWNQ